MTKFLIFTTPRTGSTLLIKSLDSHPEVFCGGELFFFKGAIYHNEWRYPFLRLPLGSKLNYLINYPKIFLSLKGFLNKFFTTNQKGEKARGFKLMHFQTLYTPGIFGYLKSNDVKVIVLIRKNILRNTLSDLRARATKVYHNEKGAADNIPKFNVDLQELGKKMKQIHGFNIQLEKSSEGLNRKIVYYEDFENWEVTLSGVLRFIEVADIPVKAISQKLNPEKLEDMIENYTEFCSWINDNGYSKYLD
jgi:LPS sulfotransferase NodH